MKSAGLKGISDYKYTHLHLQVLEFIFVWILFNSAVSTAKYRALQNKHSHTVDFCAKIHKVSLRRDFPLDKFPISRFFVIGEHLLSRVTSLEQDIMGWSVKGKTFCFGAPLKIGGTNQWFQQLVSRGDNEKLVTFHTRKEI